MSNRNSSRLRVYFRRHAYDKTAARRPAKRNVGNVKHANCDDAVRLERNNVETVYAKSSAVGRHFDGTALRDANTKTATSLRIRYGGPSWSNHVIMYYKFA